VVPGYEFIPHNELPGPGKAFIVSFISQRGLVEGEDFILAA